MYPLLPKAPFPTATREIGPKTHQGGQRALPTPKMLQTNLESVSAKQVGDMGVHRAYQKIWVCAKLPGENLRSGVIKGS